MSHVLPAFRISRSILSREYPGPRLAGDSARTINGYDRSETRRVKRGIAGIRDTALGCLTSASVLFNGRV